MRLAVTEGERKNRGRSGAASRNENKCRQPLMADRMTPETLHQECHAVHKDVIRLIGEMSPDELRLKALDLQAELEASERKRRENAETITRMQEEQSATLEDLRNQVRAGEEERDKAAQDRLEEIERLRHRHVVAKGARIDAGIALDKRKRRVATIEADAEPVRAELEELKQSLATAEAPVQQLRSEEQELTAQIEELDAAIAETKQLLVARAEVAARLPPEEDAEPEPEQDVAGQLLAMEAKLSELCGLIQQRDAEIAALRQTVTHECTTRTHLLASIKRSSRG